MGEFRKRSHLCGNDDGNEVETSGNDLSDWETNRKQSQSLVETAMQFFREQLSLRFPSRWMSHP